MFKLARFMKSLILLVLFTASLNLSVQAAMPDIKQGVLESQSSLSELDFFLLPFGERESSHSIQPSVNIQTFQFSSALNTIALLNQCQTEIELFYRQNSTTYRDHPFILVVRKLRI